MQTDTHADTNSQAQSFVCMCACVCEYTRECIQRQYTIESLFYIYFHPSKNDDYYCYYLVHYIIF